LRRFFRSNKIDFYETFSILPENVLQKIKPRVTGIIMSGSEMKLTECLKWEDYGANIYYYHLFRNVPILGICFGCQLLHVIYGGKLREMGTFLCKKAKVEFLSNVKSSVPILNGMPREMDMQFCYSLDLLPITKKQGKEIAWISENGKTCAYEYEKGRVYGVLFHPEKMDNTWTILTNFIDVCQ